MLLELWCVSFVRLRKFRRCGCVCLYQLRSDERWGSNKLHEREMWIRSHRTRLDLAGLRRSSVPGVSLVSHALAPVTISAEVSHSPETILNLPFHFILSRIMRAYTFSSSSLEEVVKQSLVLLPKTAFFFRLSFFCLGIKRFRSLF